MAYEANRAKKEAAARKKRESRALEKEGGLFKHYYVIIY
jgi:hypothetical protein